MPDVDFVEQHGGRDLSSAPGRPAATAPRSVSDREPDGGTLIVKYKETRPGARQR